MIDFIICEDNRIIREIYEGIISKITMPYDFNYKVHLFEKYDKDLKKLIDNPRCLKIYLLDLELPGKSGIEISREIRKNDWSSPIIILTSHDELELRLFKEKLLILDFISKFENYEKRLSETIELILKQRNNKKGLVIKVGKELKNIDLNSIYYIYRDIEEEKTVIVTSYDNFPIRESLINLEGKLDCRFSRSHRACIVNREKIKGIDLNNKIISFDNNIKTDLLSNNYKKNFKELV